MQTSLYKLLHSNHVFADIDRYNFSVIEDYLYFRSLEVGEYLCHEGENGDFMAFVVAGELEILKHNPTTHEEIILAVKGVGTSVGDMSVLDDLSRSASIRATEKTALIILSKGDFERILDDHPKIGILMLKGIATMLSLNLRATSAKLSK